MSGYQYKYEAVHNIFIHTCPVYPSTLPSTHSSPPTLRSILDLLYVHVHLYGVLATAYLALYIYTPYRPHINTPETMYLSRSLDRRLLLPAVVPEFPFLAIQYDRRTSCDTCLWNRVPACTSGKRTGPTLNISEPH